jgi:4-amino-4-deoxy-L-arabinose transferase-like glycosyltransferase
LWATQVEEKSSLMKKKKKQENSVEPARWSNRWSAWLVVNEPFVVFGIGALALCLRLVHLFLSKENDPFFELPSVDPKVYHDWALEIANGNIVGDEVFFLSPLYPYFLGAIYSVFGPGFVVSRIIQALLGSISCVMVYYLGKQLFGRRVGFVAGMFAALYIMSIFYEGLFLVAAIQTPLNLLALIALLRCREKPSPARWLTSGICLGISALARPNVLLFAGFVLLWLYFEFRDRLNKKQMLVSGFVFSCGIGLMVFPITIRNFIVSDDLVLVSAQSGVNLYIGNGPYADGVFNVPRIFPPTRADDPTQQRTSYRAYAEKEEGRKLKPSEISGFWTKKTLESIQQKPKRWLEVMGHKFVLFFNGSEIGNSRDFYSSRDFSAVLRMPLPSFGFIVPLALVGMMLSWQRRKEVLLLYGLAATYLISLLMYFVLAHYRMPVMWVFILFASYTVVWLVENYEKKRTLWVAGALAALVLTAVFVNHEAADQSKGRFMIHFNLGNKFRMMKKLDLAAQEYDKSIAANPSYISSYNNLAVTYEAKPETYDKAIEAWQMVLKISEKRKDGMYIDRARKHIDRLRKARRP